MRTSSHKAHSTSNFKFYTCELRRCVDDDFPLPRMDFRLPFYEVSRKRSSDNEVPEFIAVVQQRRDPGRYLVSFEARPINGSRVSRTLNHSFFPDAFFIPSKSDALDHSNDRLIVSTISIQSRDSNECIEWDREISGPEIRRVRECSVCCVCVCVCVRVE